MERVALYVDDLAHARQWLLRLGPRDAATHWVVVACPPARTRHIGRWASQSARGQWARRWAEDLKGHLDVLLGTAAGNRVEHLLASGSPDELRPGLEARLPGIRIVDARRPRPAASAPASPLSAVRGRAAPWPLLLASGLALVLGLID